MEPEFLGLEDVLEIHAEQLDAFGGSPGIRSLHLVESAVAMPQASLAGEFLHVGLFAQAAAYAFHLAESQAFVDGNKRTGLGAALVFLHLNGWRVVDPGGALYDAMLGLPARTVDKAGLARLFEQLAVPLE